VTNALCLATPSGRGLEQSSSYGSVILTGSTGYRRLGSEGYLSQHGREHGPSCLYL